MNYLKPSSIAEACDLKSFFGDRACFWAGGTDLLVQCLDGRREVEHCIDLGGLADLVYIRREGDSLAIGAMTRVSALTSSSLVREAAPALAAAALATPQVRNLATVGGNLCNAAPSADLATPLLALDAEVTMVSPIGQRTRPLSHFFYGPGDTCLHEGEMLTEVRIPVLGPTVGTAFEKVGRTTVDIALVNVAVSLDPGTTSDGKCCHARIALGAVAPTPMLALDAQRYLLGKEITPELIGEAADLASAGARPIDDLRASAAYRREIVRVLTRRALERALDALEGA